MEIVILVFILVAVQFLLSFMFKRSSKVDQGPALNYYRLSYRRKMIRTLWNAPIILLVIPFLYFAADWSLAGAIGFGLIAFVGFSLQYFYNYSRWKKEEAVDGSQI